MTLIPFLTLLKGLMVMKLVRLKLGMGVNVFRGWDLLFSKLQVITFPGLRVEKVPIEYVAALITH